MGVFTLMSIIGAAVAVVMKERAKQLYITCGVLFSAGVLLAGGFVHLVSDSHDDFQELNITDFQWAFAIAGGISRRVDEELDQLLQLGLRAVGNRRTYGHVGLPAVAAQQHFQRGQQHDDTCDSDDGRSRFGSGVHWTTSESALVFRSYFFTCNNDHLSLSKSSSLFEFLICYV